MKSKKILVAVRMPEEIYKVAKKRAKKLCTSMSWVIVSSLATMFQHELPPGFEAGRPNKDWGEADDD